MVHFILQVRYWRKDGEKWGGRAKPRLFSTGILSLCYYMRIRGFRSLRDKYCLRREFEIVNYR